MNNINNTNNNNILPNITLYDWQKECLAKWFENECRGVVNVATGAGKTILAAAALKLLEENLSDNSLKIKIIVPKVFLAEQWLGVLTRTLGINRREIGLYCGKIKESENRKYMIYVINSARYHAARKIVNDCNNGCSVLLICDECHHFGSAENRKVFDFIPHIESDKYFSLGLSATPLTGEDALILTNCIGREIYKYGFQKAVQTGVVSDYAVFNVSLDFTPWEADEYEEYTYKIKKYLYRLLKARPQLKALKRSSFYSELNKIAGMGGEISGYAAGILGAIYKRKETVYLSESRIACTIELIKRLHTSENKIIIFAERISSVEILYKALKKLHITAGRYHSGLNEKANENNLERYKNGEASVLLSCRALDEGFDVPETDIGIVMSSTGSIRQRIQRIGRVLRKRKDGGMKLVYYLHIGNSTEEEEILPQDNQNISDDEGRIVLTFNLSYVNERNDFINGEYDSRCRRLLEQLQKNKTPSAIMDEVCNNLKLGAVRADWLLSKTECRSRIMASNDIAERNYWISMLRVGNITSVL